LATILPVIFTFCFELISNLSFAVIVPFIDIVEPEPKIIVSDVKSLGKIVDCVSWSVPNSNPSPATYSIIFGALKN